MSEHGPHVESWLGLQYRAGCSQDCCVDLEEWKDRGGSPGSKGENERRGEEDGGGGKKWGGKKTGSQLPACSSSRSRQVRPLTFLTSLIPYPFARLLPVS